MFLVGMLGWWYGNGWQARLHKTVQHLGGAAGFFSIGQLASTLFSPFRQISAGQVNGSVGVQMRAFADRLVSRVIGAIVRTFVIIAGLISIVFLTLYQLIVLIFWLLAPLLIIAGLIMAVIGWVPSWK